MKRILMASCLLVLLAGIPPAWGQAGGGGTRAGAAATARGGAALNLAFYTGEFDSMNQQLTLTADQKTKLQDRIATMNKEIDTFLANAPAQIAAGRRAARSAGGAGGAGRAAATPGPNPAVLKLQDDLQALLNEHQVLINQVLTPEQRRAWESYKLHRVLDPRLQPLGLTDDQQDKVTSLIDATAQSLADLADGKTIQSLQGQLFRKIMADVLTDNQLGKFMEGTLPVQGAAARATTPAPTPAPGNAAPTPTGPGLP